jgi:hypothetical protein
MKGRPLDKRPFGPSIYNNLQNFKSHLTSRPYEPCLEAILFLIREITKMTINTIARIVLRMITVLNDRGSSGGCVLPQSEMEILGRLG